MKKYVTTKSVQPVAFRLTTLSLVMSAVFHPESGAVHSPEGAGEDAGERGLGLRGQCISREL